MGVFFDSPGTQELLPVSTVHDMVHASLREPPPATPDDLNARTDAVIKSMSSNSAPADLPPACRRCVSLLRWVSLPPWSSEVW